VLGGVVLGGVVLGAVAVVAVAIAVSSGSGGSGGLRTGSDASKVAAEVQGLLAGIPQSGTTLGSSTAPVTLTYYSDLQCPVCAEFALKSGFPELLANDVREGKVKVVYRALETATRDPQTFRSQQAAGLAAGRQNHLWDYVEVFYRQQGTEGTGYVTERYLTSLATQIPRLNVGAWQRARSDRSLLAQLQSDQQNAVTAGVQGTPALIFQGPRGATQIPEPVPPYSELQQVIKSVG
jgi:protein-disulfide isomerase